MLIKLEPEQISDIWETIKFAIEKALPPMVMSNPEAMNNILLALMDKRLTCWSYQGDIVEAILTTQIVEDFASGQRNLLIYSAYTFKNLENADRKIIFEILKKYAKKYKCNNITAYTTLLPMIRLAKQLGGETEYRFISLPV